ncbi:hypothetical protein IW140_001638 [Coemansia sp. RSA 1813]|nr:hypothetical protein EV178_001601 [Coemansia sp. RSA 1646]KAJ1769799.1 hypothetical protein LPJ74_003714 [Coemansia sp. RSA 1843]KAJ2091269.1 hypothetical protein IW138_001968 [Coemansia sp. RSA 986]KAJ2216458.1 hypothetical protein EV179_001253 [Coemansia sp. RSA 487]KAJ2571458.1 hypothetical protein IW140_001638 [Coemansia sp. RSA 1813]
MIPDEKKPIPWGLPPLRLEVVAKQQQQASVAAAADEHSDAENLTTDSEKQQYGAAFHTPDAADYKSKDMTDGHHYEQGSGPHGYTPLRNNVAGNGTPSSSASSDFMSLRKRMAVFLAGIAAMSSAIYYVRNCMCDPSAINPSMFSATTLGTSPDTLEAVQQLLDGGFNRSNTVAWDRLAEMTDLYGHRMTGSHAYDRSADWVVSTAKNDPAMHSYTEPVFVDEWQRGSESLRLFVPTRPGGHVRIPILGLGNSVPTPRDGVEADIVPVHSFEELALLGNKTIAGKVVLFNFPYTGYSNVGRFRSQGAREAEKYGAQAVLVRTLAPDTSFESLHTGSSQRASIPAASISLADANFIERMYERARIGSSLDHVYPRVKLIMHSRLHKNAKQSANVIIDVEGTEKPEQIVLLSGHFDSWDIGVGAMDDGAGAFLAWEAARMIAQLPRKPKRSIRVVMWNNEETFQRGARAYYAKHKAQIKDHWFAIESDIGVFDPWGLVVAADDRIVKNLRSYGADLLKVLGAGNITSEIEEPGEDIAILCKNGVPCAGFLSTNPENGAAPGDPKWETHYFRYHHASSDRMEIIDKHQLRRSAAALAAWSYLIADL